ncbi:hypothetical protein SAMN05216188_11435 [Lentzea xinjiangensis]|uniref:PH domain-containing protein n=1 Tax=Lentzea xinjiangensis TaxID=402600 RepID=A0A1H9R8M4_9PSEU|nr:hypothetical protein [Lentzea xinjiangensis]SER69076.1 hypothetical protein SAMN05216188_11435 [Lentzea xinjiangensis]
MADTAIHDGRLVIEFTAWERVFTWRRRVEVPLGAVREVRRERHPFLRPHGVRVVGAEVAGTVKSGIWRGRGGRQLVAVRGGMTAVWIRTEGHGEFLVSLPEDVIAALEAVVS